MKTTVLYQYLGTNGTILSPVHLEDAYYVRKIHLVADVGYMLTNGEIIKKSVTVPEADVSLWKEVPLGEGQM